MDPYQSDLLQSTLAEKLTCPFDLHVLNTVNSTNDYALNILSKHSSWQIVVAESQSQGRGRRGRAWRSPVAKHIYLTLAFCHEGSLKALQGLSIVLAIALRKVLLRLGLSSVSLKWPNDILVDTKKLAGILVDIRGETPYQVAAGIGLNVAHDEDLASYHACALADYIPHIRKQSVLIELIPELIGSIQQLQSIGLAPFCDAFDQAHAYHQKWIHIQGEPSFDEARVLGLAETGALMVEVEGKSYPLHAAEISVFPHTAPPRDADMCDNALIGEFDERQILQNSGKVSAKIAKEHAESEFEKYRIIQDRLFESDFDRVIKQLKQDDDTEI